MKPIKIYEPKSICMKCLEEYDSIDSVIFQIRGRIYNVCPECADKIERFIKESED